MHTHSDVIAGLIERVADLDDAPDRARHEWFYADLARIAEDICTDAHDDGYTAGHKDGYDAGRRDGTARRHAATVTATRVDGRPRHRVYRRDPHNRDGRGGIG
jgi:hypothetical protein